MNIDQINLGTAKTINVVASLPTAGTQNFQQHTLFKLPSGDIYRLTKPIVNATPASGDFELLFSGATTFDASTTGAAVFDATKDYQVFNADTTIDVATMAIGKNYIVECDTDCTVTLSNGTIQNKASSPLFDNAGGTFANMRAGDLFVITKLTTNLVAITF